MRSVTLNRHKRNKGWRSAQSRRGGMCGMCSAHPERGRAPVRPREDRTPARATNRGVTTADARGTTVRSCQAGPRRGSHRVGSSEATRRARRRCRGRPVRSRPAAPRRRRRGVQDPGDVATPLPGTEGLMHALGPRDPTRRWPVIADLPAWQYGPMMPHNRPHSSRTPGTSGSSSPPVGPAAAGTRPSAAGQGQ